MQRKGFYTKNTLRLFNWFSTHKEEAKLYRANNKAEIKARKDAQLTIITKVLNKETK